MSNKKLILFGTSDFAEVAYELFTYDSDYEVCGFTVSETYLSSESFLGKPVVPFERLPKSFPPSEYQVFIALVYNKLNRTRKKFYHLARDMGYQLATYVSSQAFVWRNVTLGDNVFIFENNVLQPFVSIGSNAILWSGNHVGHHSAIGSHTFVSSHVVVSGKCSLGENGFYGVNSCIGNDVSVGDDCFIGANALVVRDIPSGSFVRNRASEITKRTTYERFDIEPPSE